MGDYSKIAFEHINQSMEDYKDIWNLKFFKFSILKLTSYCWKKELIIFDKFVIFRVIEE